MFLRRGSSSSSPEVPLDISLSYEHDGVLSSPSLSLSSSSLSSSLLPLPGSKTVVVAVNASRYISKQSLEWAMNNVVDQGDRIVLLALLPKTSTLGRKVWTLPRFITNCIHSLGKNSHFETEPELIENVSLMCSHMIQRLNLIREAKMVKIDVRVVSSAGRKTLTKEAEKEGGSWIVFDRHLKREGMQCLESLHQCNIVLVSRNNPKILHLNDYTQDFSKGGYEQSTNISDASGSSPFTNAVSTVSNTCTSPKATSGNTSLRTLCRLQALEEAVEAFEEGLNSISASTLESLSDVITNECCYQCNYQQSHHLVLRNSVHAINSLSKPTLLSSSEKGKEDMKKQKVSKYWDLEQISSVRKAISLWSEAPPGPPPLCSLCKYKAPLFGKPARTFTLAELDVATGGFCKANFLAEGGFGSVYRGLLPDGQAIAVKQHHKVDSPQADIQFCSEVELLSCAQHRNVVMLIGYCIEGGKRLLVYEFICNASLDLHLHGDECLGWCARQKIAIGTARGLRYLHEECRLGSIVHRDLRPNNILLTHDFEPMLGDFGLAQWQAYDGADMGVEESKVIGTFGYLAPEYAQTGQFTYKADVYSFGVLLLELISGRKAVDMKQPKGERCITEWAQPFLDGHAWRAVLDPGFGKEEENCCFSEYEAECMMHAASLCIQQDPNLRPRMSQVLRILEGNIVIGRSATYSDSAFNAIHRRRDWKLE